MTSGIESNARTEETAKRAGPKFRLTYMDGLRGFSAIIVATHHLYLRWLDMAGNRFPNCFRFLLTGHCFVAVFVVLSGYTLMLPVARSKDHHMVGGWWRFITRRARRILPAYYAGLGLAIIPLLPRWIGWPHLPWVSRSPTIDISFQSVIVHLLLIQNLRPLWGLQINSAFWSISTEWQLYFLFPLLLLPLWRRAGGLVTIAVGLVIGISLGFLIGFQADSCPWYLGLFAMGMTASGVSFVEHGAKKSSLAGRFPWGWICLAILALDIAIMALLPTCLPVTDPLMGLSVTALLIACTYRCQQKHTGAVATIGPLLRALQSKFFTGVGTMSYSLYLVHMPLIVVLQTLLTWRFGASANISLWLLPPLTIVTVAAAMYVFHHLFERPFMVGHPRTEAKAATSATLEPAM
jgi:peptidoglycan/LPS O-acetylase OafA/YrhL